jgi:hypothetical protein
VVAKLRLAAELNGWETAVGYSRAWEKQGRGKVGGEGDARWVLRHFVGLQVRRPGLPIELMQRAIYGADVDMDPLEWTVASVQVDGYGAGILAFRKLIKGKVAVPS